MGGLDESLGHMQTFVNNTLKVSGNFLFTNPFPKQDLVFMCLQYKSFENTVGKGEIARDEQCLLFPQSFYTCLENFLPFFIEFKTVVCKLFSLEESKICRLVMG